MRQDVVPTRLHRMSSYIRPASADHMTAYFIVVFSLISTMCLNSFS